VGTGVSTLVTGVAELVTADPAHDSGPLGLLADAAVVVGAGMVEWVGRAATAPPADRRVDVEGGTVLPGFVDSHAHLVFAGDRSTEFEARMAGTAYDGGGIASTVHATRAASDDVLRERLAARLAEMRAQGTTTVEVKSGYGLTVRDELRALRLAGEVTAETTFLGAHVVPPEYTGHRDDYVDLVTGEMLTASAFADLREVVSRFYKLIFVDTGNNVRAQNWQAAVEATDQLVLTMSARNDSAETAARMLDHLEQQGSHRLVRQAVTVVSMPPSRRDLDIPAIVRHFAARTRIVLLAPYERLIDSGEPLRYSDLSASTKASWLKIAAAVAEGL